MLGAGVQIGNERFQVVRQLEIKIALDIAHRMLLTAANGGTHQPYAPAKVRRDPKLGVSPILVIPFLLVGACCLGPALTMTRSAMKPSYASSLS